MAAKFPTNLAGEHKGLKNSTLHKAGVLTDSPEKAAAAEDIRHSCYGEDQQR